MDKRFLSSYANPYQMCRHLEVVLIEEFKKNPTKKYANPSIAKINGDSKRYHMAVCCNCKTTLFRNFDQYHRTDDKFYINKNQYDIYHS